MKGKKEITPKIPDSEQSLENHFKQEFVDYAKGRGKEINQDTFWDSANGLLLSFMFQQMATFYEISANLKAGIEDLFTTISQKDKE